MEATRTPKLAPYLVVDDAREMIDFLEKGLGGTLTFESKGEDDRVHHAEVRIADSVVVLSEGQGENRFSAMLHLYVDDADAAHRRAMTAGAKNVRAPEDQSDGDRRGGVQDRWGNQWWFTRPPAAR
ncbi:MAG TPA: VOC family protein [Thermoplasmata archaeon]|nr:VOC family protein [Thermoplasmata archaeon]